MTIQNDLFRQCLAAKPDEQKAEFIYSFGDIQRKYGLNGITRLDTLKLIRNVTNVTFAYNLLITNS